VRNEYSQTLKALRQSYSRQVLMNIMSNAKESLDEASKRLISKKSSFAKLCSLIHNEYMVGAHIERFHGNSALLEQNKSQIKNMMTFMKDIPGFRSYFLTDLFTRAI
jgi:hypothetical protein